MRCQAVGSIARSGCTVHLCDHQHNYHFNAAIMGLTLLLSSSDSPIYDSKDFVREAEVQDLYLFLVRLLTKSGCCSSTPLGVGKSVSL